MQSIMMAIPILQGKTESVKAMFKTVKNDKWKEYDAVQKKIGLEKERDFLQVTSMGDMLLIYFESKDIQKTFMAFSSSKDPFSVWYINEIKKNTGIDFSQPPAGPLPELLLSYDKAAL
jgi:hypothetical protein